MVGKVYTILKHNRHLLFGCIYFVFSFLHVSQIEAAPVVGFKPTLGKDIHLATNIAPGKLKKIDYTVVNLTDGKLSVLATQDIPYGNEETDAQSINSARSFITLPTLPLILDPSERKYLSFNISIPANTVPGQYQSVITLVRSDNNENIAQSKITITVDGELKKALGATLSSKINETKISLNFDLENKGNTAIDNVVAHVSLINNNLKSFIKLPKEMVIPLNVSLSVGEKVTVTKLLETPLDPWANYAVTINLDYGAKQQLPLATNISYQNQSQINKYLLSIGIALLITSILLFLIVKTAFQKRRRNNPQQTSQYIPKHHGSALTVQSANFHSMTDEQMKTLINTLKSEVRTIIREELNKPELKEGLAVRKLAKHDLMDSLERYFRS